MPGKNCIHCGEPILPAEMLNPIGRTDLHLECGARLTVGSVGHQLGECSCFHGTHEDPPGKTKREAASLAYSLFLDLSRVKEPYSRLFQDADAFSTQSSFPGNPHAQKKME